MKQDNTKIDNAIRYITRHPVQFGATSGDRRVLTESSEFRADFANHLIETDVKINRVSTRTLARTTWDYYIVWVNLPYPTAKA